MAEPRRKGAFVAAGTGANLAWLGQRLRYLVVSEQTAGRFAVSALSVAAGAAAAPHVLHREHEGVYVLSGELTVTAGKRRLTLPAGGFLDVAPGTARAFANAGRDAAELLVIVGPAGVDEFQFRAGMPLAGPQEAVPEATDEDRETLASLAPGYGVELNPPSSALAAEPRLRLTLPDEGTRLALVGDLYRLLAVANDTSGRYALLHATIPPGGGPPPHSHSREDEAFYVLAGTVTFQSDGGQVRLGPGGFAHLPSGTRHRFANESEERAEMLILVAPAGFEKLIEATGRVWHDAASFPGPPDAAEIERLVENAPKYGVELYL